MIAPWLAVAGGGLIGAGALLLRRLGSRVRIGRLLAAAAHVSLAEAQQLAAAGMPRYVRVHGRVSSDEEFPDDNDRPLVFRRRRIEVAESGGRWRALADDREAVPFGVAERDVVVWVDAAALTDGLVVIPREAVGRAADLPPELSGGLDAAQATRLLVEQVSAVEHAFVAGVPARAADGSTRIGAGLGRPLILTTLELPAAMRVLARGQRRTVSLAAALLAGGLALLLVAALAWLAGW